MHFRISLILVLFFPYLSFSQVGGSFSYSSLNLVSSARSLSMGGSIISVVDDDVSLSSINPSLLNDNLDKRVAFNFVDYVADINLVSVYVAKKRADNFYLFFGFDAINYGEFDRIDDVGDDLGTFYPNEQIFTIGVSKYLSSKISMGTNFRLLNSQLESYDALVVSSNIGLTYYLEDRLFTSSVLIKNLGVSLERYSQYKENLPFEIQLGISKELKHLPFRYSLVLHHLNKYNISHDFSSSSFFNDLSDEINVETKNIAQNLLDHVIIGGELNPFNKNLYLRCGINFQQRNDLTLNNVLLFTGFSFGFGVAFSDIQINYSRNSFHTSSMLNSFSVSTNLSKFGL